MRNGGQLLVECLVALGATRAFGVPGESYLAVLDALPWTKVENAQVVREKGHGRQETRTIRLVTLAGI